MAVPIVSGVSDSDFLKAIWGETKGVAELTAISKAGVKGFPFTYPDSLNILVGAAKRHNENANVYMGVCLRREPWPRKNRRGETEFRGTEENVLCSRAVWAEFDFTDQGHKGRTISADEAQKRLKAFPHKPSIVNRSGGGIQVFWLLKEPATDKDLAKVKAINRALAKFLDSDPQSTDLARILRIPWTKNLKYDPPRTVEVAWWHPEFQYVLDDFDFLPLEIQNPNAALADPASPGTQNPNPTRQPRPTPTTKIEDDTCILIGKKFADIWFEGWRHEMALCVAGWLAHSDVALEGAMAIVAAASNVVQGDTKKRLKDVEDTYRTFTAGEEVKGFPSLVQMIDESFPLAAKDRAKKTLSEIGKFLPKKNETSKRTVKPDFKILWLTKFTSEPARWTVTIEKDSKTLVTSLEHSRFIKYDHFVEDVCDQNTLVPEAPLKNNQWREMINEATKNGLYEEREAPAETRPAGAIEKGLEDFMSEAKEKPDIGLLKKYAGYDEEDTFFLIKTFKDFLEEGGYKITQNHLIDKLRAMGWKSATRRFGRKVPRVWVRSALKEDGGNGNGKDHEVEKNPASSQRIDVTPPQKELFQDEGRSA